MQKKQDFIVTFIFGKVARSILRVIPRIADFFIIPPHFALVSGCAWIIKMPSRHRPVRMQVFREAYKDFYFKFSSILLKEPEFCQHVINLLLFRFQKEGRHPAVYICRHNRNNRRYPASLYYGLRFRIFLLMRWIGSNLWAKNLLTPKCSPSLRDGSGFNGGGSRFEPARSLHPERFSRSFYNGRIPCNK